MTGAIFLTGAWVAFVDLLAWSWGELCTRLPEAVRNAGPRRRIAVAELEADGQWQWAGQVETTWLGSSAFTRRAVADRPTDAILVIPDEAQFRTRIRLGEQACRRGEAALELRRGQFTPIPPETAIHASAFAEPIAGGGGEIDIAVIRKTTLDSAIAAAPAGLRDVHVVGALDPDGRSRFRFYKSPGAGVRWIVPAVALLIAILLSASLWSARLDRDAAGLDARRANLMVEARELRRLDEAVGWAEALRDNTQHLPLSIVMTGLAGLPDALPPAVVLERVRLEPGPRLALQTAVLAPDGVDMQTVVVELGEVVE